MNALLKRKGTGAGNNGNVSKGKEASKGGSPSAAQNAKRDAAILYAVPTKAQVQPEAGHRFVGCSIREGKCRNCCICSIINAANITNLLCWLIMWASPFLFCS